MSDLSKEKEVQSKDAGFLRTLPQAAEKIWKGSLCMINAAGYVSKATATANSHFGGIAVETKDNSAGAAGDTSIGVYQSGTFLLTFSDTLTIADVGTVAYATDTDLATITSAANKQLVGKITEFVSASLAWVTLCPAGSTSVLGS